MEKSFRFCFYDLRQSRYREIPVIPVAWRTEQKTEFFTSYAVAVQQEDYRKAVRALFCQYDRYIRLKLEEDDSDLAEQMTGYPAKEDDLFADSFQEQMVEWFGTECMEREEIKQERVKQAGKGLEILQSDANRTEPELALELDHPLAYTVFTEEYRRISGRLSGTLSGFSGLASGQECESVLYWECLLPPAFSGNRTAFCVA